MTNIFFDQDFLFDSHCHLSEPEYDEVRDVVVERAGSAGVERIIDVATTLPGAAGVLANTQNYPGIVYTALGVDPDIFIPGSSVYDPNASDQTIADIYTTLRELIASNLGIVVAIGETGIDDYWLAKKQKDGEVTAGEREQIVVKQSVLFTAHLELAAEFDLPLTIHSRAAEELCLEIIRNFAKEVTPVFHSYTGNYEVAANLLDLGGAIGVNAIATYKNADNVREVLRKVLGKVSSDWSPTDFYQRGVYFETDGPYLPPASKRGEVNEPGHLPEIMNGVLQSLSE